MRFVPSAHSVSGLAALARSEERGGKPERLIFCLGNIITIILIILTLARLVGPVGRPVSLAWPWPWPWRRRGRAMVLLLRRVALPSLLLLAAVGCPRVAWSLVWYTAWVSTVYTEPGTNRTVRSSSESGRYGDSSPKDRVQGLVGIPRGGSARPAMDGCAPDVDYEVPVMPPAFQGPPGDSETAAAAPQPPPWIALVAYGGCNLKDKIAHAVRKRAAAVVIYNEARFGNSTLSMSHLGEWRREKGCRWGAGQDRSLGGGGEGARKTFYWGLRWRVNRVDYFESGK